MSDRNEQDESISLEEARAAKRLAEAMEGASRTDAPELRIAARIASTGTPELSRLRRDAIAEELFGAAPARQRGRGRVVMAIAASLALVAGIGLLGRNASETAGSESAEALVAALLPAPTAAQRAELIARNARGRMQGESP